ncbi:MAG: CDC48 family AAA ATPase [archaeon]
MVKDLKLKVAEAIQDDVNKGIVRIDSSVMHELGIRPGDIIDITGERATVGIADRAYPGDIGLNIIRMDGLIRRNAKAGIGDLVLVKKCEIVEGKKVVIAPQKKGMVIRANPIIFKQGLLGRAVVKGDIVSLGGTKSRKSTMSHNPLFEEVFSMIDESLMGFGLGDLKFVVINVDPKQAVVITEQTVVQFNPESVEVPEEKVFEVTYEDVGGLEDEVKKIREMVELPLKHPELFETLGIEPPKGVLLHGPPGTGKTLLAKAVANETSSNFVLINGPEIMSKYYGQSEENLRNKFEEAEKNAPSIIFIDEIDAIASKREEVHGEVERRVVAQLLAIMDGLKSRGKVVVIGATNIPNSLDPALRRPGRFDREIEIGVPGKESRLLILNIHTRNMPLMTTPESISPYYKKEAIVKYFQLFFKNIDYKELIKQIPAKPKNIQNGFEELNTNIKNHLKNIAPKEDKKNQQEFFDLCLPYLSRYIAIRIREFLVYEKGIFSISKESENMLSERISNLKQPDSIEDLISQFARELILKDIADITHGFVGADLSSLAKEAAMVVLRRVLPEIKLKENEPIPKEILEKLRINHADFMEALKVVRPSAMREVLIEMPNVKWESIGGLNNVKQELIEAVEWPLKYPEAFKRMGVKPPKGILLYGAPGTGKTLLGKAVATETKANFILIKGPELLSKWVGESEKAVRKIFEKARQASPTIIFFDELDSLAPRRGTGDDNKVSERVVNQLLTEIDGLQELHDIVVIGATNRPDIIDTGLLRPGRFDRIILAPVPDREGRLAIFKIHTKGMPIDKSVSIEELADRTEGYVGADIEAICREAAILALRIDIKATTVKLEHFEEALNKVSPSVNKEVEQAYVELLSQFRAAKGKEMKEQKPRYFG